MRDAQRLNRKQIYRGRVVDLALDAVRLPNGHTTELELIEHPGAAAIVPLTDAGEVILVRQYRYATSGYLLEVPAGKLDAGEVPEQCAARELVEEIGQAAGRLDPLGWIWTTPGFTNERIWLYLARDLRRATQDLDVDEVLSLETVPLTQAVAMARGGDLTDAKSIVALLRAAARLEASS